MAKFTQDKWRVDERNGIIWTENKGIARVLFEGTEEGRANARLIAHAPEMYKLLLILLSILSKTDAKVENILDDLMLTINKGREVIACIDGKENATDD